MYMRMGSIIMNFIIREEGVHGRSIQPLDRFNPDDTRYATETALGKPELPIEPVAGDARIGVGVGDPNLTVQDAMEMSENFRRADPARHAG
jgi:hypothetical protein